MDAESPVSLLMAARCGGDGDQRKVFQGFVLKGLLAGWPYGTWEEPTQSSDLEGAEINVAQGMAVVGVGASDTWTQQIRRKARGTWRVSAGNG